MSYCENLNLSGLKLFVLFQVKVTCGCFGLVLIGLIIIILVAIWLIWFTPGFLVMDPDGYLLMFNEDIGTKPL